MALPLSLPMPPCHRKSTHVTWRAHQGDPPELWQVEVEAKASAEGQRSRLRLSGQAARRKGSRTCLWSPLAVPVMLGVGVEVSVHTPASRPALLPRQPQVTVLMSSLPSN